MKIRLLTVCKNERAILPFFLEHYLPWVDEIVIADGNSDDGGPELAREIGGSRVRIVNLDSGQALDDFSLMEIRNEYWKQDRNNYDWQIVCDLDEFLYHPYLLHTLDKFSRQSINLPKIRGYEMMSLSFPSYEKRLVEQVRRGWPNPQWLNKQIIFNPREVTVRYDMGCHTCSVEGPVKQTDESLQLLHYRSLGYDYMIHKAAKAAARLSVRNQENNLGFHYAELAQQTRGKFENEYRKKCSVVVQLDRFYLHDQDPFVYDEMFNWNVYQVEPREVQDCAVLDVGAQYGMFTTLVHDLGAAQVLSVEANPMNYLKFIRNTQSLEGVRGINVALGSSTGDITTISNEGGGSTTGQGIMNVVTMTLKDVVNNFLPVDRDLVLKMDVEGAEYDILYAAPREILRRFDRIFIEIHGPKHRPGIGAGGSRNTVSSLVQYIIEQGFQQVWKGIYHTNYPDSRGLVDVDDVYVFKFIRE